MHQLERLEMFKKNVKHLAPSMFGIRNNFSTAQQKEIQKSEEFHFYNIIFCNIKEEIFEILYSDKKSRPNAPINVMVSALILMNRFRWTYKDLFKNIWFNLLVKIAVGLDNIEEIPFCPATLFNFQNKLTSHFVRTGEDLLEQVFDSLTDKQLKRLNIQTNIQRTDSFA